jgi:hypothetical protein
MFAAVNFGYFIFFLPPICKLKIKSYRTIILPVVLYGCETSSVSEREELSEDEGSMFLRNFGTHLQVRMVSQPRRPPRTYSPP